MGFVGRLDGFQRRRPAAGLPIAVVYKYADDSGLRKLWYRIGEASGLSSF